MENLKVFQVNDYEWVCANTKEEAVKEYLSITGLEDEEEAVYEMDGIIECDLDTNKMFIEEDGKDQVTFREGIKILINQGSSVPFILCSTEW